MSFIGTLSQTLTLRAAFASSTYLLSQIPGPGRSSDDDFLNPPNLFNPPDPLFKGAHQASVRTRAHGHRFAVLRPASDDALLHLLTVLFRTGLFALFRGFPKHCRDVAVNFSNNLHVDILWMLLIVN